MSKKKTTEEFIYDVKKIHGDKYDYSLVEYINNRTKVKIICPIHGVFEQIPIAHNQNKGCNKCGSTYKLTTEFFISKSINIHGNKYDYSLSKYINNSSKIKIICPEHGVFEQIPNNHLNGYGCEKCSIKNRKKSIEYFIKKSIEKHGHKYNYDDVDYIDSISKVKIYCNDCKEYFFQKPNAHLNNGGCLKCSIEKKKTTTEEFVKKSKIIHSDTYEYSLVNYDNSRTKVKIICKEHGEFEQTPNNHLNGKKCKKCENKNRRLNTINTIIENKNNGYQLIPFFNKNACKIFDDISIKERIFIQHAMNGGEYYIKELGYWVDGYDKENNIVYEFDEKYHKYKKEKDIIRQKEIEIFLKCKFIRIYE
ncbi:hypothetical protein M0Q50_00920 [bacterium]|jgi:hypothetical protein|nr:hypothetical protein [bacterium]